MLEQQRTYVRAFQPHFLGSIMNRLAIKMTNHHPNVPYKIKDIHEAMQFILQGTTTQVVPTTSPSYSSVALPPSNEYFKTETLATMMAKFTKTMNEALSYSRSRGTFTKRCYY